MIIYKILLLACMTAPEGRKERKNISKLIRQDSYDESDITGHPVHLEFPGQMTGCHKDGCN
jgi:hypothetical protein